MKMKRTLVFKIILISLVFLFCKEETPIESQADLFTFSGKAYSIVDSQKVWMKYIKVYFRDDSTTTDKDGAFSFENVPNGIHKISFVFSSQSDSTAIRTFETSINGKDKYEEFLVYQEMYFIGSVLSIIDSQKVFMENVQIILPDDTTYTKMDGTFLFAGYPFGNYQIIINYLTPEGVKDSKKETFTFDESHSSKEFLVYHQAKISGRVFTEINNEKIYTENVKVLFLNDSTITSSDGYFSISYNYIGNEGYTRNLLLKFTEDYFETDFIIEIKNDRSFDEYFISPKVSFQLEAFLMRDSEKILLSDAEVKLDGELINNVTDGNYYKDNFKVGSYELLVNYPGLYPISDSIKLSGIENKFSYEMTSILDEDIIYVKNNNYYLRYSDGETKQITSSNENISSDVDFYSDKKKFIYLSSLNGNYFINEIDLNNLSHSVLFSSNVAIRNLRISPNEDRIYFVKSTTDYWTGSIFYFDLSSQQEFEVNPGPFFKALLFHDCERVFFTSRETESEFQNHCILNFSTGDTLVIGENHLEIGLGTFEISPNDNYILLNFNYDGIPITAIYNTISNEYIHKDIDNDGFGMLKFTDDSYQYYGNLSNTLSDRPYPVVVIDITSGAKTIIDESNSYYGFNTLSYSLKSNKYLYSLDGDIKVFDVATKKNYNFIATDAEEHSARFVAP